MFVFIFYFKSNFLNGSYFVNFCKLFGEDIFYKKKNNQFFKASQSYFS